MIHFFQDTCKNLAAAFSACAACSKINPTGGFFISYSAYLSSSPQTKQMDVNSKFSDLQHKLWRVIFGCISFCWQHSLGDEGLTTTAVSSQNDAVQRSSTRQHHLILMSALPAQPRRTKPINIRCHQDGPTAWPWSLSPSHTY